MEIYQSRKRTIRQGLNLVITALCAAYFLYSYQSSGWSYDITCGVIFSLWSLYVIWWMLKKRLLFKETSDGFVARGPFTYSTIRWDQLVAVGDRAISDRILLLVWKNEPNGKEKFLPLSKKSLEPDNLDQIFDLIMTRRPDLPAYSRGELNSVGK